MSNHQPHCPHHRSNEQHHCPDCVPEEIEQRVLDYLNRYAHEPCRTTTPDTIETYRGIQEPFESFLNQFSQLQDVPVQWKVYIYRYVKHLFSFLPGIQRPEPACASLFVARIESLVVPLNKNKRDIVLERVRQYTNELKQQFIMTTFAEFPDEMKPILEKLIMYSYSLSIRTVNHSHHAFAAYMFTLSNLDYPRLSALLNDIELKAKMTLFFKLLLLHNCLLALMCGEARC